MSDNPEIKIDKSLERKVVPKKSTIVPQKGTKRHEVIRMPYIGNVLSVNHYKFGHYTKPEVKEWMNDLVNGIKCCQIKDWKQPLKITIVGTFKNERAMCDTHNILKIVADCVQAATGLNDKFYQTETLSPVINKTQEPHLDITIQEI